MQMVILAGGLGHGIRPLSESTPGPLVEVEGRPFLAYQFDLLRANGIRRVVLCVGHLAHQIRAHFRDGSAFGLEICYSEDGPRLLGTAGALRKARDLLDESFFVAHGHTYVVLQFPRIWSYFHRFAKPGLLVVQSARSPQVPFGQGAPFGDGAAPACSVRDGFVSRYQVAGPRMDYCDMGVALLRRRVLGLVPPRQRVDLPWLFDRLARSRDLLSLRTDAGHHSIASSAGLSEFRRYIAAMSA
jgi:NDP-sugar pyrophosphorylase family protein